LNAIKYKGDRIDAWRALAGINERTKAYQALFENLRRIVELDPNDIDARLKLGQMLLAGAQPMPHSESLKAEGKLQIRTRAF